MRPKIVIAVLLLGALLAGSLRLLRQAGGQSQQTAPAASAAPDTSPGLTHTGGAPVPGPRPTAGIADATKPAATGPKPAGTEDSDSSQARHRAYVESRVAELLDLGAQGDPASLETILSELTNRDPAIRRAALGAAMQVRSRDAIPRLVEAALQTDDPHERAAIADAIEFLKLPALGEVMGQTN